MASSNSVPHSASAPVDDRSATTGVDEAGSGVQANNDYVDERTALVRNDRTRLVSAGELVRNIDDHIGAATAGNPVIVLGDADATPVAALVSVEDLKYLGRAAEPPSTITNADYATVLSATPPGQTPIGVHLDQTPATVTIRGHHLIVARDGYGADQLLCSAIAGAALSRPAAELGFVIATSAATTALPPRLLEAAHIVSYQPDLRDETLLARFVEHLNAEVRTRRDALRRLRARSVEDVRQAEPDLARSHPELADLVIVIDRVGELMDFNNELNRLVAELLTAEASLGLHLWMINPTPVTSLMLHSVPVPSLLMDIIVSRIALQTFSPNHSRSTLGIPDAAFIAEPGVGFHKPDNLTAPQRFAVAPLSPEELDDLADTMASRVGHHMFDDEPTRPRWADALPESISLNDMIERWEAAGGARNTASVPIGLIDNTDRHEISPFAITFNEAMHAVTIVGANRDYLTAAVDAITTAAAATNDVDTLRFIYIGPSATELRPMWTMSNVDIVNFTDPTKIAAIIEGLKHQIDLRSESGHTVLIIDGWDRWQTTPIGAGNVGRPAELVVDIARRGPAANVHVIVTTPTTYYSDALDSVTDERIELHLNQAYESKLDKAAAAVIPDDPHHGLTRRGRLLIIDC